MKNNKKIMSGTVSFAGKLLIILILSTVAGCSNSKKDNNIKGKVVPVEILVADKGEIEQRFEFTGTIDTWKKLNLLPDVGGKISKIYVNIGDRVNKGDVLAELDQITFKLRLEQAEAGAAVANAAFASAERNYKRALKLKQEGSMSIQQFEQIETGYESAKAQLKSATAALDLAKWQIDVSIIKAPFSGVITARYLNEGDMINPQMPGAPGIVQLMDLSNLKIQVWASEKEVQLIKKGQTVLVYPDALNGSIINGVVQNVNMAANPATRTFLVEVKVPNQNYLLKAGMFCRLEIVVNKKSDTIIIPSDAVLGRTGDYHVFVVKNKRAQRQNVVTGIRQNTKVEILTGISTGDSVIVTGQEIVMQGSPVEVNVTGGR